MKKTDRKIIVTILLVTVFKLSNAQFTTVPGNILQSTSGNVGIGFPSYTPAALLEVKNGSVLCDGTTGTTPASGGGTRLMWIPAKGAFRAGQAILTSWDDANIGANSIAFGIATKATSGGTSAFGNNTVSSGLYSFATGNSTIASGVNSFSANNGTIANGATSFAAGYGCIASGNQTAVFGYYNTASAYSSFVIGSSCYNPGTYSSTTWVATDPLFVIGNGTTTTPNNALTVLKNGNVLINKVTQVNSAYLLDVNGKIRANEIVVNTTGADFVFDKDYKLMPIGLLEQIIKSEKHLPGIAPASEMQTNGVGLAELNKSLLQKVEELTLYIIEQNKRIEALETIGKKNK